MTEKGEPSEKLIRDVYDMCDVYPLPDRNDVEEEVKKVKTIMNCRSKEEPSDRRVARRISKALDLRRKLNTDEWVEYDGQTVGLEK